MIEAALIHQCADPQIEIAIVERFIAVVGSDNPLSVTITSGDRIILPQAPQNADAAVSLIRRFVGQATVRVGVTQYPAGYGVSDATEIPADLVDACQNIRMGSALFGKVYWIVAHARGEAGPGTFREALAAWRTGIFEDAYVFGEADPGPLSGEEDTSMENTPEVIEGSESDRAPMSEQNFDPYAAGIRVDLSTLKGQKNHE
ncbi:conjugal transfer protein TraH [Aquamicrobium segne]|uniref:Conjugal transfer protein TraH n=1 Tax=Aquamicrobium segne TaxID=469547 RepID=A0ABW0GZE8_9HYPH